jgi:hypothetical protein
MEELYSIAFLMRGEDSTPMRPVEIPVVDPKAISDDVSAVRTGLRANVGP